jgi:elongation factor 3
MMAPSATSATPAKAGAFDLDSLFVADKAARDEAQLSLATAAKKEGVEFLGSVGFCDAVIKVSENFDDAEHFGHSERC